MVLSSVGFGVQPTTFLMDLHPSDGAGVGSDAATSDYTNDSLGNLILMSPYFTGKLTVTLLLLELMRRSIKR